MAKKDGTLWRCIDYPFASLSVVWQGEPASLKFGLLYRRSYVWVVTVQKMYLLCSRFKNVFKSSASVISGRPQRRSSALADYQLFNLSIHNDSPIKVRVYIHGTITHFLLLLRLWRKPSCITLTKTQCNREMTKFCQLWLPSKVCFLRWMKDSKHRKLSVVLLHLVPLSKETPAERTNSVR